MKLHDPERSTEQPDEAEGAEHAATSSIRFKLDLSALHPGQKLFLTPEILSELVLPYLSALAAIQHIIDEIKGRPPRAIGIQSIKTGSVDVIMDGVTETLYIEVKSILNVDEMESCFAAAARLRKLCSFKNKLVSARKRRQQIDSNEPRCFYTVFAYESNLTEEDWLKKEWKRIRDAAKQSPTTSSGEDILCQWFVHLINFLVRENSRRQPIDWLNYTYRKEVGWQQL